jgi:thiol-disulfide isomerase/thioredoxin
VLLDFWGTWCAPCREATPPLGRLAGELHGEPFELVGIGHEPRGVLEVYVAKHDMEWIQIWDRGGEVTRERFGVTSYPTYVLLDHEGQEVFRISGWHSGVRRRLERKVHAAVREAREAADRD